MEKAFFDLFAKHRDILRLEVGYTRQTDWIVTVYRAGIDGEWILGVQNPDRNMVFAKAYVQLVEWYCEKLGGY